MSENIHHWEKQKFSTLYLAQDFNAKIEEAKGLVKKREKIEKMRDQIEKHQTLNSELNAEKRIVDDKLKYYQDELKNFTVS